MEASLIDLAYLERFCKGDRSRMERYVDMYLKGSPAMFADLGSKMASGDGEGLAVAAHSLRPQVNYMGAKRLFELLTWIEGEARANGSGSCSESVQRCMDLNGKVVAELRAWLDGK